MFRCVGQEFKKLRSQRGFQLLFLLFLLILAVLTVTGIDKLSNQREYSRSTAAYQGIDYEQEEKDYIKNYSVELENSIGNLEDRSHSPLVKRHPILKNSLLHQAQSLENLKGQDLNLQYDEHKGAVYLSNTVGIDVLILVFLFLTGALIFNFERRYQTNALITSIEKGGQKKAGSKLILYLLFGLFLSLLTYTLYLLGVYFKIGFGDLSRNIQSMIEFRNASMNLTVLEYLLLFLVQKTLAVFLAMGYFALIFSYFKDFRNQFLLGLLVFGLNFVAFQFIAENSFFEVFKYSSIFANQDVFGIWGQYSDVFLFSFYAQRAFYGFLLIPLLMLFFFGLSYVGLKREREDRDARARKSLLDQMKMKRLFSFESYRLLFPSMGILALLVFLFFGYQQLPEKEWEPYDYLRISYKYSLNEFQGRVTPTTLKRMEEKKAYYEGLDAKEEAIYKDFEDKKINYMERDYALSKIEEEKSRIPGFQLLSTQLEDSYEKTGASKDLFLLDEKTGQTLFGYNSYSLLVSLVFYLLLLLVVSETFIQDEELKMNTILKTTSKGHLKLLKKRVGVSYLYGLLAFAIGLGILFLDAIRLDLLPTGEALVQSFPNLLHFDLLFSFDQLWMGYLLYAVVNVFLTVNLIIYCTQKIKNRYLSYSVLFLLMVLPNILLFFARGLNFLKLNPLSNLFSVFFAFSAYSEGALLLMGGGTLLLGWGLYLLNKRAWKDS